MRFFIESKNNKDFKKLKSLKERKYREAHGLFLLEGEKLVKEAYDHGYEIDSLIMAVSFDDDDFLLDESIHRYYVKEDFLKEISDLSSPPSVIASVKFIQTKEDAFDFSRGGLIVDGIQDPGNLGTIIRILDAYHYDTLYLTKGTVDFYHPKVVRSTMGSFLRVKPRLLDDDVLQRIKNHKKGPLLATSLSGSTPIEKMDLEKSFVIVGSEGRGVSQKLLDASDTAIKIPMPGHAESLNVAVATGIILYEKNRQENADE